MKNFLTAQKMSGILLGTLAWYAVILQACITTESYLNFLSYFTIWSNIIVAFSLTFYGIAPSTKLGKYFSSVNVQSAIALYIFIVGLVYNLVLRGIWTPTGWQLLADNLLHVAVPILYLLYWIIFIPKGKLNWKSWIIWTILPLAYLVYSLIRGHYTGWYPYPFLNVAKLGYNKVFINTTLIVLAFILISLLLIMTNRFLGKNKTIENCK